jgi:hypothetical protein
MENKTKMARQTNIDKEGGRKVEGSDHFTNRYNVESG